MGSQKTLQSVKDYAVITLGLVIYLFAYFTFIYSHQITSGGLAGIASVISWAFKIPFSLPYNIINGTLLLIALRLIGWQFSVKTVYSVVTLGLSTSVIESTLLPYSKGSSHCKRIQY